MSSANIIGSSNLVYIFKSFTNMRKSNAPSMELWGKTHRKTSKLVFWSR